MLRRNDHCNRYLQNAWNAHGEDAFTLEVLELVADRASLRDREQFFIDSLDACNPALGYNLSPSAVRMIITDETRARISAKNKGRKRSEEVRLKLSIAMTGRVLGPHSQEHRQRISEASKGKPKTDEHRRRIAIARAAQDPRSLSHPHTQETKDKLRARVLPPLTAEQRLKISVLAKARPRPPHTEETKAKIAAKARARGPLSSEHRAALSAAFAARKAAASP